MINVEQLRKDVIEKALISLGTYSDSGLELLTLTCAQESMGGTYIKQIEGPALGIFQMEPKTHEWLWSTFLPGRGGLAYKILASVYLSSKPPVEFLTYNMLYAAMMCRVKYLSIAAPMPQASDIEGLALYWHTFYNCNPKVDHMQAVSAYNKLMKIGKSK